MVTGLKVNHINRKISTQRGSIFLTPKGYSLFYVLFTAYPNLIPRDKISKLVWEGLNVSSKAFDVQMSLLRTQIKPLGLTIEFMKYSRSYKIYIGDEGMANENFMN